MIRPMHDHDVERGHKRELHGTARHTLTQDEIDNILAGYRLDSRGDMVPIDTHADEHDADADINRAVLDLENDVRPCEDHTDWHPNHIGLPLCKVGPGNQHADYSVAYTPGVDDEHEDGAITLRNVFWCGAVCVCIAVAVWWLFN